MPCPHCAAPATTAQPRHTALGYRTLPCYACRRTCNARTGTPYNHRQYPTDLVVLVVLWRLRYKRSLRDLAEMFRARGTVKLSLLGGDGDPKVGNDRRIRDRIQPVQVLTTARTGPAWGGFVQSKLNVTVPIPVPPISGLHAGRLA